MVTVQCSFKPIMNILPRKQAFDSPFVPLIANRDHYLDPAAFSTTDQAAPANVALEDFTTTARPVPQTNSQGVTPTAAQLLGTVDVTRITNSNLDLSNTNLLRTPGF